MKIKICGITNYDDAIYCSNIGADAIGFIFYTGSKRYIEPDKAKKIIKQLPPFLLKVGVFVNEEPDKINKISEAIKLNVIQLHGDETIKDIMKITLPVIKAFRVNKKFNYKILNKYSNHSILLDSFNQNEYGGTGEKFNWNNIPVSLRNKIILAGGVSLENIEFIYNEIKPYAIDLSSSLEYSPGKKDHKKIKQLFTKLIKLEQREC